MIITENVRVASRTLTELNLSHLKNLNTDIGVWQHCKGPEPNVDHGYSIDDVARALIVAVELWQRGIERQFTSRLGTTCLKFLEKASLGDGKFHNFADKNGNWLDSVGSEDSFGRTLWALALAHRANLPFAPSERILPLLNLAMNHYSVLGPLRSRAFVLQALSYLPDEHCSEARGLIYKLQGAYYDHSTPDWDWYEPTMTYCNARVPLALLLGSKFAVDPEQINGIALKMLDFLLRSSVQPKIGGYAPIGNDGWFKKGDIRPAVFDQQPVDAGVLVEACVLAWKTSKKDRYRVAALEAMEWYHGRNINQIPVYSSENGGVYDALTPKGVNYNQGAESILSYIMAKIALDDLE